MDTSGFALLVPAFGQIQAEALAGLAGLAVRYGEGGLRPTPWKSLCIAGIAASDAETVLSASAALGLVTWADDGRLSIITCAGAPACSRAEVETITTAAIIARTRRAGDALLHLSGCAKGCAHPGPAPLTLVGHEGKFDLVRGGKASETPETRDVALAQISPLMQSLPS
jgi:precorrin-3B synthase